MNDAPKRSAFRRFERVLIGLVMGVIAFVLEKVVLRSIKKGKHASTEPMVTSRGGEISAD